MSLSRLVLMMLVLSLFVGLSAAIETRSPEAVEGTETPFNPPSLPELRTRQEAAGASCSPEGQWNCMTNSFQRCASGQWSVVMDCALGTICEPSGVTMEFRIEHDGSVNGEGGGSGGGTGGFSRSPRGSISVGAALCALIVWLCWGLH